MLLMSYCHLGELLVRSTSITHGTLMMLLLLVFAEMLLLVPHYGFRCRVRCSYDLVILNIIALNR